MADVRIEVDMNAAWRVAYTSDGLYQMVRSAADARASRANALAGGFKTERYHRDHKSPAVGGTSPEYGSNTRRNPDVPIGIVYTGNYAAQKENMLHNTLLKCI